MAHALVTMPAGMHLAECLTSPRVATRHPPHRGSTGFGRDHWLAGDRQWGLTMQIDNDDAAAWLVQQGIAAKGPPGQLVLRRRLRSRGSHGRASSTFPVCHVEPVTDLGRVGMSWSENRLQRICRHRRGNGPGYRTAPRRPSGTAFTPEIVTYVLRRSTPDRSQRSPR